MNVIVTTLNAVRIKLVSVVLRSVAVRLKLYLGGTLLLGILVSKYLIEYINYILNVAPY